MTFDLKGGFGRGALQSSLNLPTLWELTTVNSKEGKYHSAEHPLFIDRFGEICIWGPEYKYR